MYTSRHRSDQDQGLLNRGASDLLSRGVKRAKTVDLLIYDNCAPQAVLAVRENVLQKSRLSCTEEAGQYRYGQALAFIGDK